MDDILAKKNRHLFLEEKDNVGNSFIANVNKVAASTDVWYALKGHTDEIETVADNINDVHTVAENIDSVNTVADNIDDIEFMHSNIEDGTLEALLDRISNEGNDWLLRIAALGNRLLNSKNAFNYAAVATIPSDIAANATITLPESMSYLVGAHMLLLSWNGTICYKDEQYKEIGTADTWSTTIKTLVPLKAGDKLEFRTVAVIPADTQVIATGSLENRTLADRFGDVCNVKDFGAVGDGVENDTAAFQAALATGKAVFVPEGSYKLTTNLTGNFCSTGNSTFTGGTVNGSTILRGTAQRNSDIVNVKDFGAKGDGATDDTAAIQAAFNFCGESNVAWFPPGTYRVTSLTCQCSILGSGTYASVVYGTAGTGSVITWTGNYSNRELSDIRIKASDGQNGIYCTGYGRVNLHDFYVELLGAGVGIKSYPNQHISRFITANNFFVLGRDTSKATAGVYLQYSDDSRLSDFELMRVQVGIFITTQTHLVMLSNCHIYCGSYNPEQEISWWNQTAGIKIAQSGTLYGTNVYIDTACIALQLQNNVAVRATFENFNYWDDGAYGSTANKTTLFFTPTYFRGTKISIFGGMLGMHLNAIHTYSERLAMSLSMVKVNLPADFDGAFSPTDGRLPKSTEYRDKEMISECLYDSQDTGAVYTAIAYIALIGNGFVELKISDSSGADGVMGSLTASYGPIFKWVPVGGSTSHRLWYKYDSTTKVATIYEEHYNTAYAYIDIIHSCTACYVFRHDMIQCGEIKQPFVPEKLTSSSGLTNIPASS